ncbi:ATP-binding protein [Nocardioides insulae]|uniref:ATP-binding protein n=1 Tax=Nocardioides insulae TaxID=394734 RepID=UPI0003F91FEA|nr:ATP-binding protein [Nocardioides insulae]
MSGRGPAAPAADDRRGLLRGLLDEARERGFVGRTEELAAFTGSARGTNGVRLHFVHGPGGIGKTTLLEAMARVAVRDGRSVSYLDARDLVCSTQAVAEAIGTPPPDVLLVDGYELLEPLDGWFRELLVPSRPADGVTVLAGRAAPPRAWLLDPGWRQLSRVHHLDGLDPAQSADLLARSEVPAREREGLARLGRGHPLALAMLAEAAAGGSAPTHLSEAPDVVTRLCQVIVDDVPDAAHRAGLATCAHATRMTYDLLEHTVGARAEEVWGWLESRPYVRRGAIGLFLHDVVREVFEAEFAHRAPDAYADLHRRIKEYFLQRLVDPRAVHPDRSATEILMLHRKGPLSEETATLRDGGLIPIGRAGPEEHEEILGLVAQAEGPEAAALAERWLHTRSRVLYRMRSEAGVLAFALQVYLSPGDPLAEDDPVAAEILRVVQERAPLRPGERININRFAGASEAYQRDPLVLLVNGVSCILEWALEPAAWTFIASLTPDLYGAYFEYLGMEAMFSVDHFGTPVVGYGWDRRRFPATEFFELMARRELSGETGPPPASMLRPAPLGHDAFAAAVRDALTDLRQPDRLAVSPLTGTALVEATAPAPVEQLVQVLIGTIADLQREPRGADHRTVLERTYLKGAPTQEAAAELLDLPFSTYRRHLARAQERLIELLWAVEIGVRRPPVRSD